MPPGCVFGEVLFAASSLGQIVSVRGDPRADGCAQPGGVLARRGHVTGAGDQERAGVLQPRSLVKSGYSGTVAAVKRGVKRRPGSVAYPRTNREERTMP